MLLITKKLPVAVLGYHTIYTIDDVSMVYIPYTDKTNKEANLEEQKYFFVLKLTILAQGPYFWLLIEQSGWIDLQGEKSLVFVMLDKNLRQSGKPWILTDIKETIRNYLNLPLRMFKRTFYSQKLYWCILNFMGHPQKIFGQFLVLVKRLR